MSSNTPLQFIKESLKGILAHENINNYYHARPLQNFVIRGVVIDPDQLQKWYPEIFDIFQKNITDVQKDMTQKQQSEQNAMFANPIAKYISVVMEKGSVPKLDIPQVQPTKTFSYFSEGDHEISWHQNDNLYCEDGLPVYTPLKQPDLYMNDLLLLSKYIIPPSWKDSKFVKEVQKLFEGKIRDSKDFLRYYSFLTLPFGFPINDQQERFDWLKDVPLADVDENINLVIAMLNKLRRGDTMKGMQFQRNEMTKNCVNTNKHSTNRTGKKDLKYETAQRYVQVMQEVIEENRQPKLDLEQFKATEDLKTMFPREDMDAFDKRPLEERKSIINAVLSNKNHIKVWQDAMLPRWVAQKIQEQASRDEDKKMWLDRMEQVRKDEIKARQDKKRVFRPSKKGGNYPSTRKEKDKDTSKTTRLQSKTQKFENPKEVEGVKVYPIVQQKRAPKVRYTAQHIKVQKAQEKKMNKQKPDFTFDMKQEGGKQSSVVQSAIFEPNIQTIRSHDAKNKIDNSVNTKRNENKEKVAVEKGDSNAHASGQPSSGNFGFYKSLLQGVSMKMGEWGHASSGITDEDIKRRIQEDKQKLEEARAPTRLPVYEPPKEQKQHEDQQKNKVELGNLSFEQILANIPQQGVDTTQQQQGSEQVQTKPSKRRNKNKNKKQAGRTNSQVTTTIDEEGNIVVTIPEDEMKRRIDESVQGYLKKNGKDAIHSDKMDEFRNMVRDRIIQTEQDNLMLKDIQDFVISKRGLPATKFANILKSQNNLMNYTFDKVQTNNQIVPSITDKMRTSKQKKKTRKHGFKPIKEEDLKQEAQQVNSKIKRAIQNGTVALQPADAIQLDSKTFAVPAKDIDNDQELMFEYNVFDPIDNLDEMLDKEFKYASIRKGKQLSKIGKKALNQMKFDTPQLRGKVLKQMKEHKKVVTVEPNDSIPLKDKFPADQYTLNRSIRASRKARGNFYGNKNRITQENAVASENEYSVRQLPLWITHGQNKFWFNKQAKPGATGVYMLDQVEKILKKLNMPEIPVDLDPKYRYTKLGDEGTNSWTNLCTTIKTCLQSSSTFVREKATHRANVKVEFFTGYSRETYEVLTNLLEDSPVSMNLQKFQGLKLSEMFAKVVVDVTFPMQWVETPLDETTGGEINYIPNYINSGFNQILSAWSTMSIAENSPDNICKCTQQQLDVFASEVTAYMKKRKIFTGTQIGQLNRYAKCIALKTKTTKAPDDMMFQVLVNRFVSPQMNLELLGNFELLLTACLNPNISTISIKSSSGFDYGDQKKSIATVIADVINAYKCMNMKIIPTTWLYHLMKPKYEMQDVANMFVKTRSIFVPQSASQVLSNVVFAGMYDVEHFHGYVLDTNYDPQDDSDFLKFREPNLLGIVQQEFLKQIILNKEVLQNKCFIWSFSDNLYTLVHGRFTSYDGAKMESQIKPSYIRAIGEYAEKSFVSDYETTSFPVDKSYFTMEDDKLYFDSANIDVYPYLYSPAYEIPQSDEEVLGFFKAYSILLNKTKYCVNDLFDVEEDEEYPDVYYLTRKEVKIPEFLDYYLLEALPYVFENAQGILGSYLFPLGFLPSGWRLTSFANSVLSLTVYTEFYKLVDAGSVTKEHDEFEKRLLEGKFTQISFTKESSVENVWDLHEGFNNFDFLGYGIMKRTDDSVDKPYLWVCLRLESLLPGAFWYNPQTYNKNAFINWSLALAKWVSALFNGAVMFPEMMNAFIGVVKQISEFSNENTVSLYLNEFDTSIQDMISSQLGATCKMNHVVELAYNFCVIQADKMPKPKFLIDCIEYLKDIDVTIAHKLRDVKFTEQEKVALANKYPDERQRARVIIESVLYGKSPVTVKDLNRTALRMWLAELKTIGMEDEWKTFIPPGTDPKVVQSVKAKLEQFF